MIPRMINNIYEVCVALIFDDVKIGTNQNQIRILRVLFITLPFGTYFRAGKKSFPVDSNSSFL